MWNKLIGIGSVIFPGLMLLGLATFIYLASTADPKSDVIPEEQRSIVAVALIGLAIGSFGAFGVMIAEIAHALSNPEFSDGERIGWAVALWFLNIFVITYYWFAHMRSKSEFSQGRDPKYPRSGR